MEFITVVVTREHYEALIAAGELAAMHAKNSSEIVQAHSPSIAVQFQRTATLFSSAISALRTNCWDGNAREELATAREQLDAFVGALRGDPDMPDQIHPVAYFKDMLDEVQRRGPDESDEDHPSFWEMFNEVGTLHQRLRGALEQAGVALHAATLTVAPVGENTSETLHAEPPEPPPGLLGKGCRLG